MTDNNIRIKILDEYKILFEKELGNIGLINYLIEEFNIDPLYHSSFVKPIEKLKEELNKIIIPKPIEITNVIDENKHRYIRIFKDHSEAEVDKIKDEWDKLDQYLRYLKKMFNITKLYSDIPDKQKIKSNRDTKSKRKLFIDSFLKSSREHNMTTNKEIAELNNISTPTASRLLNDINILKQLRKELINIVEKFYEASRDFEFAENMNEHKIKELKKSMINIESNQLNIQGRIEKIERMKKVQEHLELSKKGM